ncbi:MAG: M6 family metalloprotease domain-containing protein [Bacteroidales bacterium]|nr:M6 family metalloprotease domain-containing protein [Bacteroidales bacterium]
MKFKFSTLSMLRQSALAIAVATPLLVSAIPAKPGIVTITTEDGRELRLEKRGGPFSHAVFTDDGLLLSELSDGTYVYAGLSADGLPEPTAVRACAPELRTAEENRFVARLRNLDMVRALELRDAETARMKAPAGVMKRDRAENPGLCPSSMTVRTGSPKCLVLLVEFKDEKFRTENPQEYFYNSLNQTGFNSGKWEGCVSDYFKENSRGAFTPQFDVYGPVTLDHVMKYYGGNNKYTGNDEKPYDMVVDACKLIDETSDIDFSQYDNDGDGLVDNVFIYYAGFGEANSTSKPNTIWPHSADLSNSSVGNNLVLDGVRINHYACCNEVMELVPATNYWVIEGIGVFVHEFSHVLGLPDLYETIYQGAYTPKYFNVLDVGSYNNDGHTPPNYSAFERYALGWMKPEELRHTGEVTIKPLIDTNHAYFINTPDDNEYYLIENRVREGWDTYLPGEGMLVWHVDYVPSIFNINNVNDDPYHHCVDLIEADGHRSVESAEGDPFPGTSNVTSLGFNTTPSMRSWNDDNLMRELTNIHKDGRDIKFNLLNTDPQYTGVDETLGEAGRLIFGNGIIESTYGETVEIFDTLGTKVATLQGGTSASLPAGLYIVTTPEGAVKVRL